MEIVYKKLSEIHPYKGNPRNNQKAVKGVSESIKQFGFRVPIILDKKNDEIICGHTRYKAAVKLKMEEVPCIYPDLTDEQILQFRIVDNKVSEFSKWDDELLLEELGDLCPSFKMDLFGFKSMDADDKLQEMTPDDDFTDFGTHNSSSAARITPSSVLESSKEYQKIWEYWKSKKIIKSDGRADDLIGDGKKKLAERMNMTSLDGTSVFNPVLCECMYRWFCPRGGLVYDCFAGGYTRGIVSTTLGLEYLGIDLRQEQVDTDIAKADELGLSPVYVCDDALNADLYIENEKADMVMTCPPYFDLEVYSDDERDLSTMSDADFRDTYKRILEIAYRKLKNNRFFVIVVSEVRDKKGNYREFVADTIRHCTSLGMYFWDEIILRNTPATTAMTARTPFSVNRRASSIHQNVLVFYKGNPQEIADVWGEEEF